MKVFRNDFIRVIYKSLKTTVGSVWKKYNELMENLRAVREHRTDEV
jgi:SPX domain protein involved in polyphosphate accumulation